ncbi:hypothetical protein [Ralstonia phage RP13]|nr:hypothetical protein [Ralstonia phage RP13]
MSLAKQALSKISESLKNRPIKESAEDSNVGFYLLDSNSLPVGGPYQDQDQATISAQTVPGGAEAVTIAYGTMADGVFAPINESAKKINESTQMGVKVKMEYDSLVGLVIKGAGNLSVTVQIDSKALRQLADHPGSPYSTLADFSH